MIIIMILISAGIIYVCSYTAISLKLRYPKTDCKAATKNYVGKGATFDKK